MRRALHLLLVVFALAVFATPAFAAYTYNRGDTVNLGFSSLPSGYTPYWWSDRDGYLMGGNPLRTTTLTVGTHKITYVVYRTSSWAVAARGTVDVIINAPPAANAPSPAGSAVAPGEFEQVTQLLLGTPDAYSVEDLYPQFLDALRGVVSTRIYVDNQYVRYDLEDIFARAGVDDADYSYATTPVDSIWMRDYGPLFTKNNGRLEVVDLDYYDERPNDDAIPGFVAREKGFTSRRLPLYWEGGNYTADGRGNIFATDRLYNANSEANAQIDSMVGSAFYGRLNVFDHMRNDGGTQHLDMFVLMTGARSLFVNKFPSGHVNQRIMDQNASRFESLGYSVTRLDLADTGFSSYTNGLFVNTVALVPTYARTTQDNRALAAFRAAGYRAVGIDCRRIIQWSGAIHCITITVPR